MSTGFILSSLTDVVASQRPRAIQRVGVSLCPLLCPEALRNMVAKDEEPRLGLPKAQTRKAGQQQPLVNLPERHDHAPKSYPSKGEGCRTQEQDHATREGWREYHRNATSYI
jgi:hypothetical protein